MNLFVDDLDTNSILLFDEIRQKTHQLLRDRLDNDLETYIGLLNVNNIFVQATIVPLLVDFNRLKILEKIEFNPKNFKYFKIHTYDMYVFLQKRGLSNDMLGQIYINCPIEASFSTDMYLICKNLIENGVNVNQPGIKVGICNTTNYMPITFQLLLRKGLLIETNDIDIMLSRCPADVLMSSNVACFILAGVDWTRVPLHDYSTIIIDHVFYCLFSILNNDYVLICKDEYDEWIENKVVLKENNLVDFSNVGTNFYNLPYHQIHDALHMLLFGNYAKTHPLHKKKALKGLCDDIKIDKSKMFEHFDEITLKLRDIIRAVGKSKLGEKIANTDYESTIKEK